MKNKYSFILMLTLGVMSAQGTESFDKFPAIDAKDYDGSYEGDTSNVMVHYNKVGYFSTFPITGKGITLNGANKGSYVEIEIPNGVGEFTFKYRKVATSAGERRISILVDNVEVGKTDVFGATSGKDDTIHSKTIAIQKEGNVKIKLKHSNDITGIRQIGIDDIVWTAYAPTLSTNENMIKDNKLIENTFVSNNITFLSNAEIKIYNIQGMLVKVASVNEKTRLDVSNLSSGIYIIVGNVKGKMISQKIIKK